MKELKKLVDLHQAGTRPVDTATIQDIERKLGFALSDEYKHYLSTFGVIVFDAYETYGLGVPDDYYLNVFAAFSDLSRDPNYPKNTVPVLEIGDGQYYLYDNQARKILVWATPNGGIVRALEDGLEAFLIKHVFAD
ncbi:SMI1/KNR4 family protein [Pseudomonas sp. MAFF 301449]|uniref:SMI1/KNR4 family protein n=1 Tax=Pseudomonas cyclaminis TaxID=2781239 RepID=A0ABR9SSN1_9PSED|nr:SMI1/KNR4 family protein [Pseudomonas cyclaminis]MBE8591928.1 SMI1/KNR4 family protein [Pseudomonas cyclaminis]MBE8598898.1 SMI1/KNR4 family protein [Pseudomonas cyclaminis]